MNEKMTEAVNLVTTTVGRTPNEWIRAVLILVIAIPLLRLSANVLRRTLKKRYSAQAAMVGFHMVNYGGGILILLTVLAELGFKISTLLGAAGVAGVAIGFASQTSLSNLISGIFLIWERPFEIGDVINIDTVTGIVEEIDLLSAKIRKFDNTLVRIPNEDLIKTRLTNITRYPIRRFDIEIGVAYKEDVGKVMQVLRDIARNHPLCLDEPEPLILFKGFGQSSLDFLFGVWFSKTDFLALRNSIQQEIHQRFKEEGIEIPFPHLTVYTGSETAPFPVQVTNKDS
jgi:small-conductance mechanosensitive channel